MGLSDDIEAVLQATGLSDDIEAVLQAMDFQMMLKLSSSYGTFRKGILKIGCRRRCRDRDWSTLHASDLPARRGASVAFRAKFRSREFRSNLDLRIYCQQCNAVDDGGR